MIAFQDLTNHCCVVSWASNSHLFRGLKSCAQHINGVHIGIQGKRLNDDDLKPANLVFLIDSSGSMQDRNKLPLLKKSLTIETLTCFC